MNEKNMKLEVIKAVSIADLTIQLLMKQKSVGFGFSNTEIADMIKKNVDGSKTSSQCVAWYRSHMKKAEFAKKHGIVNYIPLVVKNAMKEVSITIEVAK